MARRSKYPAELRELAVRLVFEQRGAHESEWAAICSMGEKMGCTGETLRKWVRQAGRDAGGRPGLTTTDRDRLKDLERENRELKRANEILQAVDRLSEGIVVRKRSGPGLSLSW